MTSPLREGSPNNTAGSPAPSIVRVDDHYVAHRVSDGVALALATSSTPQLSWIVPLVRNGQQQTAYEIRASKTEPADSGGEVWNSGIVESSENAHISWAGTPLTAFDRVAVAVRTTDEHGHVSPWSAPVTVETGPLERADWAAHWITFPAAHAASGDIEIDTTRTIARAVLHFAGHAVIRAEIDGTLVNPGARDLTDTSLTRSTSRSYDVTALIATGAAHRISLVASVGHYRRVIDQPRVIAHLQLTYTDGTTQAWGSGQDWTHTPTELSHDEPFYLEEHDANLPDEWRKFGTSGAPVTTLTEVSPGDVPGRDEAPGTIVPDAGPPIRTVRRLTGELVANHDGIRVYDLGENIAGRSRIELESTVPGEVITVVHGEKRDARGYVDTTNIRMPDDAERERQLVTWRCTGEPLTIEPWFAVGGFRYLEIRGYTGVADPLVSAGVLHSDAPRTGWLETDVPEIDALLDAVRRTQLNNSGGFPSDCPTREQAGWTGDASMSSEAALSHLGLEGMYRNWLADVALDQKADGGIRGVAPNLLGPLGEQGADPVWGSALNEITWQLWQHTGDLSLADALRPALRRWAEWQRSTLENGVVRHADLSFGADWLALEQTPPVLLQTAAVIRSLRQLADLEDALGDSAAAAERRSQADTIVTLARAQLRDPVEGTWGTGSQGSTGVALASGLAPEEDRERLSQSLRAAVAARGDRLSTGFSATKATGRALSDADGGTAMLDTLRQREQPGIGSMLVDGPGTLWETWWIDDTNVGVASLDHVGLGTAHAVWAWTHAAGLRPLAPGFRRFAIAPQLLGQVNRVRLTRETVRGTIDVQWDYSDGTFAARVVVPVGSEAVLSLPGVADTVVGSGIHSVNVTGVSPAPRMPASAPASRREHQGAIWLSDGNESQWKASDAGMSVTVLNDDYVCTPVFHEPMPAPLLAVSLDRFEPERDYWIRMEQDGELDLSPASFAFASFDVDSPGFTGRTIRPRLRLTARDGSTRESTARPLPIAWNRVATDLTDWAGRNAIVSVDIGISWSDLHDTARGPYVPLNDDDASFTFRVGRVGWSNAPRTY